jgi:hypothetical protein
MLVLFTSFVFSQTVVMDGGTSGTAIWNAAFGQGPTFQNPVQWWSIQVL